jgi:hypothetical protein
MTYTINNCDQGTDEWLAARKGKLTASRADEIITPTGKLSAGTRKLILELTRQCILDDPLEFAGNDATHGLEIKCPRVDTHFQYYDAKELPAKYRPQVHFSMAITGIRTWYFMSFYPGLQPLILPVEWDEYTDKMQAAAMAFAKEYEVEMPKILKAIRL